MDETKAPDGIPREEWADLPWRKLEHHLYRLQKRIGPRLRTRKSENTSQAPERANEVSVRSTLSRPTSDSGQPRQENGRDRRNQIRPTSPPTGLGGGHSPQADSSEETQAAQTGLDTQARKN